MSKMFLAEAIEFLKSKKIDPQSEGFVDILYDEVELYKCNEAREIRNLGYEEMLQYLLEHCADHTDALGSLEQLSLEYITWYGEPDEEELEDAEDVLEEAPDVSPETV